MDNLITKAKIEKYYVITLKALEIAKQSVSIENFEKIGVTKFSKKDSENKFSDTFKIRDFEVFDEFSLGIKIPNRSTSKKIEVLGKQGYSKSSIGKKKQSEEILLMVECYLKDSLYFKEKKDYVNAFACLNYAHGWLDCGARLKIFDVKDNKLFSV